MFFLTNLFSTLMMFWQKNSAEPDRAYEIGRSIGFCCIPTVIIIFIIAFLAYALIKRAKNKGPKK